jgi:co-chaperonin GroES (HSP10)
MSLQLLGKRYAIEKLRKAPNRSDGLFVEVQSEEYCGIIRYVGNPGPDQFIFMLKEGAKVYFGTKFQSFRIGGQELCVMEEENIIAVVDESV